MKLTINLRDREEIEQAIYLLERELDRRPLPVDEAPSAPEAEPIQEDVLAQLAKLRPPEGITKDARAAPEVGVIYGTAPPAPDPEPTAPPALDLDSAGQPWDADLHTSSRAKNADGTWRKRRAVTKAPPAPAEQAAWPFPPPTDMTFAQLMAKLTAAVTKGLLTPERINAACVKNGAASVVGLQTNPEAIPAVWADLVALVPEIAE